MGLISNGSTIFDAGSMASGFGGGMTLIKKLTASSSATLSFVHGSSGVVLDSTYKEYVFRFNNMHPATNGAKFQVGFRDGGTDYDATKTTTAFRAAHDEADSSTALGYLSSYDIAQGTGFQDLNASLGNGNDECLSGYLQLFNPSSTTFVKHFMAKTSEYYSGDEILDYFISGYCNVTAAIDAVQFTMHTGNIDAGTIKLYGIK